MKRFVASICALAALATPAFASTIAQWTFETSAPTTAGPYAPEVGAGSTTGGHAGAAAYSSPVGNGSAKSYSANTWAVGDYWQFVGSSTGYTSLVLDWDQTSSNTGPRDFQLQGSVNGGAYANIGAVYVVLANATPNTPWSSGTYNAAYHYTVVLSAAYDNAATVSFRLTDASTVSANGGAVAATGTDRVDNFTISGTTPEPASLALIALGGLAMFRRR